MCRVGRKTLIRQTGARAAGIYDDDDDDDDVMMTTIFNMLLFLELSCEYCDCLCILC